MEAFCTTTGFIGDKIGYKVVLVVNIILSGAAATCFDLTPRFHEHYRTPTLTIGHNTTANSDTILEFIWPLDCNVTSVTVTDCIATPILEDSFFWNNIEDFVYCNNENATFNFQQSFSFPCKSSLNSYKGLTGCVRFAILTI
jgi:hypothetical protein